MASKITSFTDLTVWQEAHKLILVVYKLTDTFPNKEQFGLTSQIRRCAVSITSNIAEGFSRQGKKEKLQFYFTSKGSLTELQNQLLIARDVGYLSTSKFSKIAEQSIVVGKLLTAFIKKQELSSFHIPYSIFHILYSIFHNQQSPFPPYSLISFSNNTKPILIY